MNFRRRCVALACAGLALACASADSARAASAEFFFPALEGKLEGNFTPTKFPGAPELHWTAVVRNAGSGVRLAEVTIEGPGTLLKAEARLDASGAGTWRLTEAQIDLGPWFAALMPALGDTFAGFTASGAITATAEGAWRGGKLEGKATLSLRDGRIENTEQKLLFEGVAFALAIEDLAQFRTAPAQELTWTGGKYDVVRLGAGRVVFALLSDHIQVAEASLAAFGGQLALGAFAIVFSQPDIAVEAKVAALELGELLPLLPPVLAAARGRVDGNVVLHRRADGIEIGKGRLSLRAGDVAEIRLAPTPGLISGSLPPAVLKYYPGLGQIETGQIPLQADLLEMEFTPDGDAQGRTASIRLGGGPVDPKLRAPIDLTVNVRGPLDELIKFSTNSRLKFGGVR